MSRSGYSEDCEYINLYRGTVERSMASKRGQAFFRRLLDALEAMPERKLTESVLVGPEGCCAMGAVAVAEGIDVSEIDPYDLDAVGKLFNISPSMAAEIAYKNDGDWKRHATDEARWRYMHDWAAKKLGRGDR